MAKEFRIYPGIGIARLGNSPASFFLSPEIPGVGPLELTADDSVRQSSSARITINTNFSKRLSACRVGVDLKNPKPGALPAELTIKPVFSPISGANQTVTASPQGKFRGNDVFLGELRTDSKGRLIVLGGRGISGPTGLPIGDGSVARSGRANSFANNEEWFDDTADGPVSATVRIHGQPDQVLTNAAWVIVAAAGFRSF